MSCGWYFLPHSTEPEIQTGSLNTLFCENKTFFDRSCLKLWIYASLLLNFPAMKNANEGQGLPTDCWSHMQLPHKKVDRKSSQHKGDVWSTRGILQSLWFSRPELPLQIGSYSIAHDAGYISISYTSPHRERITGAFSIRAHSLTQPDYACDFMYRHKIYFWAETAYFCLGYNLLNFYFIKKMDE